MKKNKDKKYKKEIIQVIFLHVFILALAVPLLTFGFMFIDGWHDVDQGLGIAMVVFGFLFFPGCHISAFICGLIEKYTDWIFC